MITAKCIQESNDDAGMWLKHDLTIGREYEVKEISVGQSFSGVRLVGRDEVYNTVYFDFYEDGEPLNFLGDARFNPYLGRKY